MRLTRTRSPRRVAAATLVASTMVLGACGLTDNAFGGGDFDPDDVVASQVDTAVPAANQLMIPPLLEPTQNGVDRFDLSLGAARHDFGSGVLAETVSYNDQSILGPTLRWQSGSDVELHVTNELDAETTAHWHGADVPAEDGELSRLHDPDTVIRPDLETRIRNHIAR